jgi:hypothetical protein
MSRALNQSGSALGNPTTYLFARPLEHLWNRWDDGKRRRRASRQHIEAATYLYRKS